MAEPAKSPLVSDEPPPGEWLFKQGDLVFGPVSGALLVEKLEAGALPPDTLVAREGGVFAPMGEVTAFMASAARAAARRRVEAQVRAEQEARRRRRRKRRTLLAAGLLLSGVCAAAGVSAAVRAGLFERHFEELARIEIRAAPATVTAGDDGGGEVAYLDEAPRRSRRAGPARAKRPRKKAAAAALGPYDRAAIQRVIQANQRRLFPCIEAEVARNPDFHGDLPFTFAIGNDGRVVKLWVDKAGYATGPLYSCMRAGLAKWRFPPFRGERPSVSLSFQVGG